MNPLLSILCITYNHDKFISEAIDSWLEQKTDFQIEIIIGDDCSTDNTVLEIKKYLKSNNHIKLIERSKNIGFINNFIKTYKKCTGKYIAICEGDDYWSDKNKLQMQVTFLENNNNYVLTHTNSLVYDMIKNIKYTLKKKWITDENNIIQINQITTHTAVFRNTNIDFENKWNHFKMADWPLWINLSTQGRFKFFDELTGVYRLNPTGVWQNGWNDAIGSDRLLNEIVVLKYFLKQKKFNSKKIRISIISRLIRVFEFNYNYHSYLHNLKLFYPRYLFTNSKLFKIYCFSFFIYLKTKIKDTIILNDFKN